MFTALQVALGGAIGATLRWGLGVWLFRLTGPGFPVAVMTANVLGSFLMGMFVVFAAKKGMTHLSPFVMTGLLGGFTTFSAFSLEAVTLWERGAAGQMAIYVSASIVFSIAGLLLGLFVARGIWV
ncbi:MAG: fluoride efflux transporter CrcB [Pseudomonadota bacterium]